MRTLLWLEPDQAAEAESIVKRCGLEVALVGSTERGRAGELASRLGGQKHDDLRGALAGETLDLALVLDAGGFGADGEPTDADAASRFAERGGLIVFRPPTPASVDELASGRWTRQPRPAAREIRPALLPTRGLAWRSLEGLRSGFGPASSVSARVVTGGEDVGAGLIAAIDLVRDAIGELERVAAIATNPADGRRSLRSLRGEIRGIATGETGGRASFVVSQTGLRREGEFRWRTELRGDEGELMLGESGGAWLQNTGERDDASIERPPVTIANAIGETIEAARAEPARPGPDTLRMLCDAEAVLLAAETGDWVETATVRRAVNPGDAW